MRESGPSAGAACMTRSFYFVPFASWSRFIYRRAGQLLQRASAPSRPSWTLMDGGGIVCSQQDKPVSTTLAHVGQRAATLITPIWAMVGAEAGWFFLR